VAWLLFIIVEIFFSVSRVGPAIASSMNERLDS
jgi:hypothetical protein